MRWTTTTLALSLALVIGMTGCGKADGDSSSETGATPDASPVLQVQYVNSICPMMGNPVEAEGGSAELNGYSIGFCCTKCAGKWEAESEQDKQAFLDKVLAAKNAEAGAPGSDGGG